MRKRRTKGVYVEKVYGHRPSVLDFGFSDSPIFCFVYFGFRCILSAIYFYLPLCSHFSLLLFLLCSASYYLFLPVYSFVNLSSTFLILIIRYKHFAAKFVGPFCMPYFPVFLYIYVLVLLLFDVDTSIEKYIH